MRACAPTRTVVELRRRRSRGQEARAAAAEQQKQQSNLIHPSAAATGASSRHLFSSPAPFFPRPVSSPSLTLCCPRHPPTRSLHSRCILAPFAYPLRPLVASLHLAISARLARSTSAAFVAFDHLQKHGLPSQPSRVLRVRPPGPPGGSLHVDRAPLLQLRRE